MGTSGVADALPLPRAGRMLAVMWLGALRTMFAGRDGLATESAAVLADGTRVAPSGIGAGPRLQAALPERGSSHDRLRR